MAYLSGHYDPALYAAAGEVGSHAVTKAAVDALAARAKRADYRGADVLLSSAWPVRVGPVRGARPRAGRPQARRSPAITTGLGRPMAAQAPPSSPPRWRRATTLPAAATFSSARRTSTTCASIERVVCRRRRPGLSRRRALGRPHETPRPPTRFLGLAAVENAAKAKWVYAFGVTPQTALDASTVCAAPPGATPSP